MTKRPNILIIMADDHRHDATSAFGDPTVSTPVLDQLAADGVAFRQAHIFGGWDGAVCVPTRAALHSGANPFTSSISQQDGQWRGTQQIPSSLALMPEAFANAGYRTFATGKWHNDRASFARCFQDGANIFFGGMSDHDKVPTHDFDPSGEYPHEKMYIADGFSTEIFADAACGFLADYDADEPFFLYMAMTSPHDPRTAPPPFDTMYAPDEIPVPPNFITEHPFDNGNMRGRDEELDTFPRTHAIVQRHMADYYGMISHQDREIGRVLATLEEKGLAENTIVIYIADHGLGVGQHGLLGKQNVYDHSIRVPMILRGPNLPAGKQINALNYSCDLFPTLCQLTNVAIPETVETTSLTPLINDDAESVRNNIFSIYRDVQRTVKARTDDGEWKLIRYYVSGDGSVGSNRIQLFDATNDPWETNDLSQEAGQRGRLEQLAGVLAEWQLQVGDPLASTPVLMD